MSERVIEKDTRGGFWIKFVIGIQFEPGIAETTKCAKLKIIWETKIEGFKRSFAIQDRNGHAVDEVTFCFKGKRPVAQEKFRVMEKSTASFD